MKISKNYLQKLIEEELEATLESRLPSYKPEDQPMMSRDLSDNPIEKEEIEKMSYEQIEHLIQTNNCDTGGRNSTDANLSRSCRLLTKAAFAQNRARS